MPARRRRGDRRIDAAIDHFGAMGYAARDVRHAVADLLKVYEGPSAWPLLEEGSYQVVQDKLFEKEDEEKQKQEQEHDQTLLLEGQQVEEEPPQHQVPAVDEAPPENNKLILLHDEVPAETESADAEVEDPMFIEPSPLEAIVPLPAAEGIGRQRKPCYGWLSESDDEEEPTIQHHEVHGPTSGGGLLCKRNQVQ